MTEGGKKLTSKQKKEICAEIQQAIIDVLIHKTIKAAKDYRAKSVILGGGVSANKELRKQFGQRIKRELPNTKYLIPDTKHCTDNAAMVAMTAYFNPRKAKIRNVEAEANLRLK
jgi:N6-L-threonylcarbamoyladenine synthase